MGKTQEDVCLCHGALCTVVCVCVRCYRFKSFVGKKIILIVEMEMEEELKNLRKKWGFSDYIDRYKGKLCHRHQPA